jgi:radical SAM superfamily enzyme YgiQ (UPF0313 family)
MKRLLLISPAARDSLMGQGFFFRFPNLGLLKVAALTPPDWEIRIVDEKVERWDPDEPADLVGLTAVTSTVKRAYEVAAHYRRRGVPVIMGGMHASALPEEALACSDSVVVGEAEGLWPRALQDHGNGELQPVYRHLDGFPDLAGLPHPDWTRYRPKGYLPVHFVETTRGCPIDCDFCAVTSAFGGRYRNRPVEDVAAELRGLEPFPGRFILKSAVFFVDDNIASNRRHARELFARIADLGLQWFGQASVNIARDAELLGLCRQSGCLGLFIGLESLAPETLRAVGKNVNRPSEYLEVIQRIHDHGIGVDASFVFGFDTDDDAVFDRTLEFVRRARIEVAYFSILTPYPGTRFFARMEAEGRLLARDWALYDANHVVHRPKNFTPDQLLEGYHAALKELYSWGCIVRRLWGTRARKNFFYPMNFGFRQSVRRLLNARGPAPAQDQAALPIEG